MKWYKDAEAAIDDIGYIEWDGRFDFNESIRRARKSAHRPKHGKRKMTEAYEGEPKVFMNTWANYNEHGADGVITPTGWMSIDEAIEYFEEYAEYEPFINDTDFIPASFDINEYSSAEVLEKVMEWDELDDDDKEMVDAVADMGYDIDRAIEIVQDRDYMYYDVYSDEDLAYAYLDDIGGVEELDRETLEDYFDYESFGRNLSFDFHKTENGYIRID